MRLSIAFACLLSAACASGLQPLAPAPTAAPKPSGWAANGVQFVDEGRPLFLVDGQYWYWHGGEWRVWRDLGWRPARPPSALRALDERPNEGSWELGLIRTGTLER